MHFRVCVQSLNTVPELCRDKSCMSLQGLWEIHWQKLISRLSPGYAVKLMKEMQYQPGVWIREFSTVQLNLYEPNS